MTELPCNRCGGDHVGPEYDDYPCVHYLARRVEALERSANAGRNAVCCACADVGVAIKIARQNAYAKGVQDAALLLSPFCDFCKGRSLLSTKAGDVVHGWDCSKKCRELRHLIANYDAESKDK